MSAAPPRLSAASSHRRGTGRLRTLSGLLLAVVSLILIYSTIFHLLMAREGHTYSWFSGV